MDADVPMLIVAPTLPALVELALAIARALLVLRALLYVCVQPLSVCVPACVVVLHKLFALAE